MFVRELQMQPKLENADRPSYTRTGQGERGQWAVCIEEVHTTTMYVQTTSMWHHHCVTKLTRPSSFLNGKKIIACECLHVSGKVWVRGYPSSMVRDGTWGTEVEIITIVHLLNNFIFVDNTQVADWWTFGPYMNATLWHYSYICQCLLEIVRSTFSCS